MPSRRSERRLNQNSKVLTNAQLCLFCAMHADEIHAECGWLSCG